MENRIDAIRKAATTLFLQQGYAKTQISHIAKAVGVSVGTIYHDFNGKKEILHYILRCTIEPDFAGRELQRPITEEFFVNLERDIIETLDTSQEEFAVHLQDAKYTFENMLSDAYDFLSKYAAGCLFIEKNHFDFKLLAQSYNQSRKKFFQTIESYVRIFIERGEVRQLEHVELTVTLIIELLSWWTMDRKYIPYAVNDVPDDLAKTVCMDNLLSAYGY